jgi:hypothetical protein
MAPAVAPIDGDDIGAALVYRSASMPLRRMTFNKPARALLPVCCHVQAARHDPRSFGNQSDGLSCAPPILAPGLGWFGGFLVFNILITIGKTPAMRRSHAQREEISGRNRLK